MRVSRDRRFVPGWKIYGARNIIPILHCSVEPHIEFPMTLKDIPKFEWLNAVSINVYSIENGQHTDDKKEKLVNLLYLEDSRNEH